MNFFKLFYFFLFLSFFVACSPEDEPTTTSVAPKLEKSYPSNGEIDAPVGETTIVLTYNQQIKELILPHGITLNGEEVGDVSNAAKELKIQVVLSYDTQYTLLVPAGKIKGITDGLAEEYSITFTTRKKADITSVLAVSNPSPEAVKVYNFLKENFGQKTISAAMANVNWNTYEADWVYQHTGKYPAMNFFDYVHLYASPANWIDYSQTGVAEDWWANNGLIGASWHWNVPKTANSTGSDVAFYTADTDFDIRKAILDGTWENEIILADLEKISAYLLLLKEKNIPVIWRPLHEAAGRWFWWGAKGAEPYKALWKLMFEFFDAKELNNLIWVWTSQTGDDNWYPGDEYVDIVGRDLYNNASVTNIKAEFQNLQNSYPNKIITLSEMGNVAKISEQWNVGAQWSWFMPWYDYARTNQPGSSNFNQESPHEHADISFWKDAFSNTAVVTRDEMPSLK